MLEEQKTKLDQQKELKVQAFQSQAEIRKTEQSLWELEKKVAMIGQPPRLDLEGITKRVGAALDEAIKLIRAKKIVDQGGGAVLGPGGSEAVAGGGSSVSSLLEPGLSLDELLQRVTSPDWLRGAGMPRNTETLKVALEARNSLMELERLHQTKMMQMVRILTLLSSCVSIHSCCWHHTRILSAVILMMYIGGSLLFPPGFPAKAFRARGRGSPPWDGAAGPAHARALGQSGGGSSATVALGCGQLSASFPTAAEREPPAAAIWFVRESPDRICCLSLPGDGD